MSNNGNVVAGLRPYPAYKESGVPWLGKVPEHWEVRRGKWLFRSRKQINSDLRCSNVLSLTLRGVVNNDPDDPEGMVPKDYRTYQLFSKGDLVFKLIDLENIKTSRVGLVHEDGIMSSAYVRAIPVHSGIQRFFYHQYYDLYQRAIFNQLGAGVRSTLGPKDLLEIPVTFPDVSEQAQIADYIDWIDGQIRQYIRAKQRVIKALEQERLAMTENALLSKACHEVRIREAARRIERPISRKGDEVYTPLGLYNRGRGIFQKEPTKGSLLGDSTFFWVADGDLVLSGQFAWEGAIALAGKKDNGCVVSHRYPILRGREGLLESVFLLSYLQTGWGQLLLDHHSRGAAGRNRPLNIRSLIKEKIPVPPLYMQLPITEHFHLEVLEREGISLLTAMLRDFRTRLFADVVTGKLDIRGIEVGNPEEQVTIKRTSEDESLDQLADLEGESEPGAEPEENDE